VLVRKICPAPPVRDQGGLGLDRDRLTGQDVEGDHAEHVPGIVLDEIDREILVEEVRLRSQVLLIQRVQNRMAGAIRRRAGASGLFLAEVLALAAKGALVDIPFLEPRKRHTEVFEFIDDLRCGATHVLDCILVAEVIGALDRVEHVPVPGIGQHVRQRRVHTALRRHRVRARREDLGHHRHTGFGVGQLQRSAQSGAAGPDDQCIELSCRQCHRSAASIRIQRAQSPSNRKKMATIARAVRRTPKGRT